MTQTTTISRRLPALKSMQYETLRKIGMQHIEELAGKLWTDYNSHDPGVSMLEVFSYALTDIGYRINHDIKDILAQDLNDPDRYDIKNFYTARQILPNSPLTINDYRKLIIDVDLTEMNGNETIHYGVRNAWIKCADKAECGIYVDEKNSCLTHEPTFPGQRPYYVKTLYDVLLEFSDHEKYGDLNDNTLMGITEESSDLDKIVIELTIEFPRWDEVGIDWTSTISILSRLKAKHVRHRIFGAPSQYKFEIAFGDKGLVEFVSSKSLFTKEGEGLLQEKLEQLVENLTEAYKNKVQKIFEILEAVKAQLHANRNLCDDWFRFTALKIEDILLCADIELKPQAVVDVVEANILHEVRNFLAPRVYFYSLEEMLNNCYRGPKYRLEAIEKGSRKIVIKQALVEDLNPKDPITLLQAGANNGVFTVKCIKANRENPGLTEIEVEEVLSSEDTSDEAYFIKGTLADVKCQSMDQIFEGPALEHGFIYEEDLIKAARRRHIRASDLIQIIMDVDGVTAVKSIQIANRPQDNDADIPSRAVKWCLELAYEHDYIPRLSIEDSKLTYYKGLVPFLANSGDVAQNLDSLSSQERGQKIYNASSDATVPPGNFQDLTSYVSIQEEFPLAYGIGKEGIPGLGSLSVEEQEQRVTKAQQLKGYLMLFDQLIYNTLMQLNHVKDLFSMNGGKDDSGHYVLDKTYFSASLEEIVPHSASLYKDMLTHANELQNITEDVTKFNQRRNRFLDHLMARFSETFTDYVLLAGKLYGSKAPMELVEDKLQFLSKYPALSAGRGKGMNYQRRAKIWHVDNVSGLENRSSLLLGIAPKLGDELNFSGYFLIEQNDNDQYYYRIWDASDTLLEDATDTLPNDEPKFPSPTAAKVALANEENTFLESLAQFPNAAAAKAALELAVLSALYRENYVIIGPNADDKYQIELKGESAVIASSNIGEGFGSTVKAETVISELMAIAESEYLNNPEANRHNLACPVNNYISPFPIVFDQIGEQPDDLYIWEFALYKQAFEFGEEGEEILKGKLGIPLSPGSSKMDWQEAVNRYLWRFLLNAANKERYIQTEVGQPYGLYDRYGQQVGWTLTDSSEEIQALTNFIYDKFFRQEGMHLIEHTLLRPRICKTLSIPIEEEQGKETLSGVKRLFAAQSVPLIRLDATYGSIEAEGDIVNELKEETFEIKGSSRSDGHYRLNFAGISGANTIIEIKEKIALPASKISGELIYPKEFDITGVNLDKAKIKVAKQEGINWELGQKIELQQAHGGKAIYTIGQAVLSDSGVELPLIEHEKEIEDALLAIHLDQDCEACQQKDPYSCVATVVLPYWPGRFPNMEMRRFTERTLREEAPAHILLNICWISCMHMHELEQKYKKWLLESSRKTPNLYEQSKALKALIQVLAKVRNVYPEGVLHDCDSDETYEGAIILNQTFLGTF